MICTMIREAWPIAVRRFARRMAIGVLAGLAANCFWIQELRPSSSACDVPSEPPLQLFGYSCFAWVCSCPYCLPDL